MINTDEYLARLDDQTCSALRYADTSTRSGSIKKRLYPYQAAWLYKLAGRYNRDGARFLEIGTYYGYTAALMSLAAPHATIMTVNPTVWEVRQARQNLNGKFINVYVANSSSWDILETYSGPELDFIFVDGDHKHIKRDLPWWNWLAVNGLMLFHDYSPDSSPRPCQVVYDALNAFGEYLGRGPDEALIALDGVGMAGWVKRPGDENLRAESLHIVFRRHGRLGQAAWR